MEIQKIISDISSNDYFILRLISAHYPFTIDEIKNYNSVLKWGSGVYTWFESDPYYQSASIALYGLCFNKNIEWSQELLKYHHFEANSYQSTGYDENAFPLNINEETKEMINAINSHAHNRDFCSENEVEIYFDNLSKLNTGIEQVTSKDFNFSTLEELTQFTNTCLPIYALSVSLFNNYNHLMKIKNIDIINSLLAKLKVAHTKGENL